MAKRRNVSGRTLRNAVPQPRDVAEFVAPRTVNEGLSVANVFGDIGDMVDPFITAAIEKQEGLRDVSDDELKLLAALGSIPVAGAVAGKAVKTLNKMVPNPKGGFINFKRIPNNQRSVELNDDILQNYIKNHQHDGRPIPSKAQLTKGTEEVIKDPKEHYIQKTKDWESLGTENRARVIAKQLQDGKIWPLADFANEGNPAPLFNSHPKLIDAQDYAEFSNFMEHHDVGLPIMTQNFDDERVTNFINGEKPKRSTQVVNYSPANLNVERAIGNNSVETPISWPSYAELHAQKASKSQAKAEERARREAEKEARWRAEREAAAKKAEEARLAREAEQARIAKEAEEAEAMRIAEEQAEAERIAAEKAEAERRAAEEAEFERQFREEAAAERNRYADSVGTALGMQAVNKDIDDWLLEKMIAEEEAAAKAAPITTTQVQDMSTGIIPGQSSVSRGGTRPTYDHSRQFMDTELKQVPGIDRTGMSYGDETDAFYDMYKAWRDAKNPREAYGVMRALKDEAVAGKTRPNSSKMSVDPYYNAGIVGDENKRLWRKIEKLRAEGKSDEKIREILKEDLDKYQGKIERFKERMPSRGHGSQFEYDGATTLGIKALPTEEVRALKALGIDTPEYNRLERGNDFYKGLTERVFNYNKKFPQSPKLSNTQLMQLKDMGISPEEIDLFLVAHPEFWQ